MAQLLFVTFVAGETGKWKVDRMAPVSGEMLPQVARLDMLESPTPVTMPAPIDGWVLRGTTSHLRYTTKEEAAELNRLQQGVGRPESTCAAFIPMRKNAAWWALAQDERRRILEESSHHIAIGMEYLPAVARRLLHSRELGEPFDFLAWLEYAPKDSDAFEDMLRRLRATEEWSYVEREIDMRLRRG